jgi:hypothetical protein
MWLFLLAVSMLFSQPAGALFRHYITHQVSAAQYQGTGDTKANIDARNYATFEQPGGRTYSWQANRRKPFPTNGVLSILSGVFPILAYTAFSLTFFPFFLVPGFVFSITAIVLGATGLRRPRNGYAIAGLSVGALELLAGFIYLILFLAFLF